MNKLSKAVLARRTRIKYYIADSLGGKCCCCGYDKFMGALELHHINPEEKCFGFGKMVSKSLVDIEQEARKCVLVCSNCHKEHHYGDLQIPNDAPRLDEMWGLDGVNIIRKPAKPRTVCPECGELSQRYRKYCSSECVALSQRRAERPTKDELEKLIKENTWVGIGKIYGVSDNAVRKWAKACNLIK